MWFLLKNPAAWLLDCEARVERGLGGLSLGMNILPRFAAVPRSYGSV
jgi:hypothetical protein